MITRVEFFKFLVCFYICTCGCFAWADKPPVAMIDNLDNLAYAIGGLNVCFKSPEFKKLSDNQALFAFDISIKADEIVDKYSKFYNDDNLLLAYNVGVSAYSEKPTTKKQIINKYGTLCSSSYLKDLAQYVNNANSVTSTFFKNRGR